MGGLAVLSRGEALTDAAADDVATGRAVVIDDA